MNTLVVPFLKHVHYRTSANEALMALGTVHANELEEVPWPDFPYKPSVTFRIAHTVDSLLLEYRVREQHIKAEYRNTNDPVYKDSCVEFFLSFEGQRYYNLEFNCLGTGLIGFGDADIDTRRQLSNATVEKVKTYSSMEAVAQAGADAEWLLLLNIPFSVFDAHQIASLAGRRCTGNFYKCGDDLPVPHFVSWNGIDHPTPNFHLPQCFGELLFSS
ncbi:carbohydrate-binding family 9-like protein [Parapedobacter sp. DT-150]|uniref:carbohydrate-binding family 9-like protein n=1 Tax=Parapedobacter sp. DT-150 TaxID=3396162 RepID=UPI003F1CB76B